MGAGKWTVLVVDDEPDMRRLVTSLVERMVPNAEVLAAGDGAEGLEMVSRHQVDLLVVDYRMPRLDGLELARRVREIDPRVPCILMTAYADSDLGADALQRGVVETVFKKPLDPDEFLAEVQRLLDRRSRPPRDKDQGWGERP